MKQLFIVCALIALAGCTDVERAAFNALGDPASVICYSGVEIIYEGRSTGIVTSPDGSDGYQFMDAATKQLTEVSGNCVIRYGK